MRSLTSLLLLAFIAAAGTAQTTSFGVSASAGVYEGYDGTPYEWHRFDGGSDGGYGLGSAEANAHVNGSSASAWGGLFSGAMHLGAFTSKPDPTKGATNTMSAHANVKIWDTITLTNTGETEARFPLKIQFDGSVKGSGAVHFAYRGYSVSYSSPYGEAQSLYSVEDDFLLSPLGGSVTFRVEASADVSSFTHENDLTDSFADYTHTLKFMWDLPQGVTYSSTSGQFRPQAVPEPASMAALGLGTLALLKRRRSAQALGLKSCPMTGSGEY